MKKNRVREFAKDPKKALITLALPVLVAMGVQALYNIVDTAFVGRLGADAIAALTFSFPVMFILIAINSGIGAGVNSRISRYLGERKKKAAEDVAIQGLIISIAVSVAVFLLGELFLEDLFIILGAEGDVLMYSIQYMRIILLGSFFMFPSFMLNNIFSAQGNTKTPMRIQMLALGINIVLDPIFIYALGYGVRGAAIATVIAFFISFVVFLYRVEHSYLKMEWKYVRRFRFSWRLTKDIFTVGAPATLLMLTISAYTMFINRFMAHYGTDYVAAFGLVTRAESFVTMPSLALSLSMLTLTGMFYGAKKYDILERTIWHSLKIGIIFNTAVGVLFFLFPHIFVRIFTNDANLIALAKDYLRIYVFTFPMIAMAMITARVMQGMGAGFASFFIHFARIFLVAIPLAYYFVFYSSFSYLSVAFAMVIGSLVATVLGISWLRPCAEIRPAF